MGRTILNSILSALVIVASATLAMGCFHKSDETGTADDITHSLICHTAAGDFLVTHEEIFHATSKSVGGGGSMTSGYADYRFTVRDLKTGKQIARLVTGDRDDDLLPLGFDGIHLWCYGADKSVGLHARDPATMKITITHEQLEQANPNITGGMSAPAINDIHDLYSYDFFTNRVICSDVQGHLFSIDPATLHATSIAKMPNKSSFSDAASTSANRWFDKDISLLGEPRNQLRLGADQKGEESYLYGKILFEHTTGRLSQIGTRMREAHVAAIQDLRNQCDSILKIYPILADQQKAYMQIRSSETLNYYYDLRSKLDRLVEDSSDTDDKIRSHLGNMVLGGDSNFVYIMHANNLTDTSSLLISRVSIGGGKFATQWTTLIPGIYYNPSKGIKSGGMADVFKSGSPDFDYEWYGLEGNTLVGIKMLMAFAVDASTGKFLWKEQL